MSLTLAEAVPRHFRFRLWPTVMTVLGLALMLGLGTWQVERLAWKTDLIRHAEAGLAASAIDLPASADLASLDFRHVAARGTYIHAAAMAFGLSAVGGEPGGRLVVPMRLEDGRVVLVDRGWLPEPLLPPRTPAELQPEGVVGIDGIARWRGSGSAGWMVPSNEPEKRRWFSWDIPAMQQALGLDILPVEIVLEHTEGPADLPKAQPVTIDLPNDHLGYAITWYGLAVVLLVIYIMSSLSKPEAAEP